MKINNNLITKITLIQGEFIIEKILNYLSFREQSQLRIVSKDINKITEKFTSYVLINHNFQINIKDIMYNDKYIKYSKLMLKTLKRFTNIKKLVVCDCNSLKDDISINKLFRIIKNIKNLRELKIYCYYKVNSKNYIILEQLFNTKFLKNLNTIYIPNIQFDAPNGYLLEFRKLFINTFVNKLTNIRKVCLNFKDNTCLLNDFLRNINNNKLNKIIFCSDIYYFTQYYFDDYNINNSKQLIKTLDFQNLETLYLFNHIPEFNDSIYKMIKIISDNTRNNIKKLQLDFTSFDPLQNYNHKKMKILSELCNSVTNFNKLEELTIINYFNIFKLYYPDIQINYFKKLDNNTIKYLFFEKLQIYNNKYRTYNDVIKDIDDDANHVIGSINNQTGINTPYFVDVIEFIINFASVLTNLKVLSFSLTRHQSSKNYKDFKRVIDNFNNSSSQINAETLIIYDIDHYRYLHQIFILINQSKSIKNVIILQSHMRTCNSRRKIMNQTNIKYLTNALRCLYNKLDVIYISDPNKFYLAKYRLKNQQIIDFNKIYDKIKLKNMKNKKFREFNKYLDYYNNQTRSNIDSCRNNINNNNKNNSTFYDLGFSKKIAKIFG